MTVYPDPDEPRRRAEAEATAALVRLLESYRSDPTLGPYIKRKVDACTQQLADLGTIMYPSDRERAADVVATLVAEVIRDFTIHQSHR